MLPDENVPFRCNTGSRSTRKMQCFSDRKKRLLREIWAIQSAKRGVGGGVPLVKAYSHSIGIDLLMCNSPYMYGRAHGVKMDREDSEFGAENWVRCNNTHVIMYKGLSCYPFMVSCGTIHSAAKRNPFPNASFHSLVVYDVDQQTGYTKSMGMDTDCTA